MDNLTSDYDNEDNNIGASVEMGSFNHSCLQANLTALLKNTGKYTVCTDLSLDASHIDLSQFDIKAKEEIKPDICIYPKRGLSRPNDIIKMNEMPLLAIEVLSPKQGTYEILEKFKAYFELGIKSCWLVYPEAETITVHSSTHVRKHFNQDEVVDEVLELRVPHHDIFE